MTESVCSRCVISRIAAPLTNSPCGSHAAAAPGSTETWKNSRCAPKGCAASKGRCEYGFVSVPATGQHEYVFHCVLPLENRRQRRCAAKTVFLRCAYFSLILYDLYIANNLYQRGSEKPEIAVSWIPDSEYKLIWASTCRKSSTAGAALGFRWNISP